MACAPGATAAAISSRCKAIASLLQQGSTSPALFPSAGQMAPKIYADTVLWSSGAEGLVPRSAQRRVILFFCPTRASLATRFLSVCGERLLRRSLPRDRGIVFERRDGFRLLRMMTRPRRELAKAHVPQFAAERLLGDRDPELFEQPLRQINQPPAHDAMDGWDRAVLDNLPQCLTLMVVEQALSAGRLAVHKATWTLGVKPKNPIAHDPQPDAAGPRCVPARAAVINFSQRQETPGLIRIA